MAETKAKAKTTKTAKAAEKYIEGIGRRKTAVARVRIYPDTKKREITINDRPAKEYFPTARQQEAIHAPFETTDTAHKVTVHVTGGGVTAQAEAIQLGLARALVTLNKDFRKPLKPRGMLSRDPRMVERKKPGLRKARRPQQWRKR